MSLKFEEINEESQQHEAHDANMSVPAMERKMELFHQHCGAVCWAGEMKNAT